MEVNVADLHRRLRCPSCKQTFQIESGHSTPEEQFDESIHTFNCHHCSNPFAIKSTMLGRLVACPFCQTQTRVPRTLAPASIDAPSVVESRKRFKDSDQVESVSDDVEAELPPRVSELQTDSSESFGTFPDTSTPANERASAATARTDVAAYELPTTESPPVRDSNGMSGWLPPKYLMGQDEVDRQVVAGATATAPLSINTSVTRIQLSDEVVAVRSLTRDEKDRRKKIRVAIVFGSGVLILVVVLSLLRLLGQ